VRRINAAYIERRIGLGITRALRFGQNVIEGTPLVGHLGKNVVGCSVDDSING
jgi:hypothetical protein